MANEYTVVFEQVLGSDEGLEAYIASVRSRREVGARRRRERLRLSKTIAILEQERQLCIEAGETDLVRELDLLVAECQCRLNELEVGTGSLDLFQVETEVHAPEHPVADLPVKSAPFLEPDPEIEPARTEQQPSPQDSILIEASPDPSLQTDLPDLSELEADVAQLAAEWTELEKSGLRTPKGLAYERWAQARAMTCKLAAIYAEVTETASANNMLDAADKLANTISLARDYAGDRANDLPFHLAPWDAQDSPLSADEWRELATAYDQLSVAIGALDWIEANLSDIDMNNIRTLLESIGASVGILHGLLTDYGGTDWLQFSYYKKLIALTKEKNVYVYTLEANRSFDELWTIATKTTELFGLATSQLEKAQQTKALEAQRKEAITGVKEVVNAIGAAEVPIAAELKARLESKLQACLVAKVPPSNPDVRSALLGVPSNLYPDGKSFSPFIAAVEKERARLSPPSLEQEEESAEELSDQQVATDLETVKPFVSGKSLFIIGSGKKLDHAKALQSKLETLVKWVECRKSVGTDRILKEISSGDIVIAVKNFASHEAVEKCRDWAKTENKAFVLLPGGYGANQVIHQIHEQLILRQR